MGDTVTRRPTALATAALLAGILGAGGCSQGPDEAGQAKDPEATSAASSTPSSSPSATGPSTSLDETATAVQFLRTWARPRVPYDQWWTELAPLLNASAKQSLQATDPTQIPALTVPGTTALADSQIDTWALVWVDTTQGRFGVQLQRPTSKHAWLVSRLWFPGDEPPL